ncbi:MAG TPA: RQC-minor-1 family DNA-binding protein [Bacteroidota bacterium]|nr:RQC-minor-1 family DNA-binding protein [Bacteroidota bacterium]
MIEVETVLRGADELIGSGGRTLLVKILRGSREKKVLELKLDASPVYGCFRDLSEAEVLGKIDWLISHDFLRYEYDGRLPLLVYTEKGWSIERFTRAKELFLVLRRAAEAGHGEFDAGFLKDMNREVIFLLLDMVKGSGDARFIPLLESWERVDYKKVRKRIRGVVSALRGHTAIRNTEAEHDSEG